MVRAYQLLPAFREKPPPLPFVIFYCFCPAILSVICFKLYLETALLQIPILVAIAVGYGIARPFGNIEYHDDFDTWHRHMREQLRVVGVDDKGAVIVRRTMRRQTLIEFVGKMPAIIAMEACCGAHHLGRLFAARGREVRLMSPEYVRPYIKAQKDDMDAEGIAEAASRPTMRFTDLKSEEQLDIQSRHMVRSRLVVQRTTLINQIRAILLECRLFFAAGRRKLEVALDVLPGDQEANLSPRMRQLIVQLRNSRKCWKVSRNLVIQVPSRQKATSLNLSEQQLGSGNPTG